MKSSLYDQYDHIINLPFPDYLHLLEDTLHERQKRLKGFSNQQKQRIYYTHAQLMILLWDYHSLRAIGRSVRMSAQGVKITAIKILDKMTEMQKNRNSQ